MRHKRTRKMGTQKYLRKSCYHRIECTVTTFLATFMWKRPLNNTVLTTTTYKKSKRVSDGTDTQVRTQMINKCKIKMVQRELYNVRDPLWGRDWKREREHYSHQNYICNWFNWFIWKLTSSAVNSFNSMFLVLAWSSS